MLLQDDPFLQMLALVVKCLYHRHVYFCPKIIKIKTNKKRTRGKELQGNDLTGVCVREYY